MIFLCSDAPPATGDTGTRAGYPAVAILARDLAMF